MNELIKAAKAVIDQYDYTGTVEEAEAVNWLVDAVERAENPPTDFDKWWAQTEIWPSEYTAAASAWIAAQQAERGRIKEIINMFLAECSEDGEWVNCCNELLEKIDDDT